MAIGARVDRQPSEGEELTSPSARVVADHITEDEYRLTTVEAVCWRPVLAEQNTHRVFSRNSASSRAIPISKNLERFLTDLAMPVAWGSEQKGMQPGPPLDGQDLKDALVLWHDLAETTASKIGHYIDTHPIGDDAPEGAVRLHKSLLNRWLEVGLWQTQIITGTSWDGYFWQRCHKAADPNIRAMAEAIQEAIAKSTPKLLVPGEWHLPYFGETGGFEDDWDLVDRAARHHSSDYLGESHVQRQAVNLAKQISAGRCARVSLVNQDGKRDIQNDLDLYARLADRSEDPTDPPHASPLEHIATPWPDNVQYVTMPNGKTMGPLPKLGNFTSYWQMRHEELAF